MKHLWQRLLSPTPVFWRKVRAVGIAAGAIGTPLAAAPAPLPAWISVAGNYLVVASGMTIALASLTCTDSPADHSGAGEAVRDALVTQLNTPAARAEQSAS